jgi:hypothetical protein
MKRCKAGWTPNETPWVDRTIRAAWDELTEVVDVDAMPVVLPGSRNEFSEYGCGYYGCALPTSDPEVTLKLTTDASEAHLVHLILSSTLPVNAMNLDGLVKYHGLMALESTYRKKPVYAIWREAVEPLPRMTFFSQPPVWINKIIAYLDAAKRLYSYVNPPKPKWEDRAEKVMRGYEGRYVSRPSKAVSWGLYHQALMRAQELANTPGIYHVGETLWDFIEQQVVICDPHLGNLGYAERDGDEEAIVLFDPGQVIFFDPALQPNY